MSKIDYEWGQEHPSKKKKPIEEPHIHVKEQGHGMSEKHPRHTHKQYKNHIDTEVEDNPFEFPWHILLTIILGFVILFASYIILSTINNSIEQMVNENEPPGNTTDIIDELIEGYDGLFGGFMIPMMLITGFIIIITMMTIRI